MHIISTLLAHDSRTINALLKSALAVGTSWVMPHNFSARLDVLSREHGDVCWKTGHILTRAAATGDAIPGHDSCVFCHLP